MTIETYKREMTRDNGWQDREDSVLLSVLPAASDTIPGRKFQAGGMVDQTTTIPQDTRDTGQLQRKDDTHLGRDDVGRPHVLPLGPLLQCFAQYSHGCDNKCDGASKMLKNEAACGLTVSPSLLYM